MLNFTEWDWSTVFLVYGVGVLLMLIWQYWPLLVGSQAKRDENLRMAKRVTETDDEGLIHGAIVFSALAWPATLTLGIVITIWAKLFAKRDDDDG